VVQHDCKWLGLRSIAAAKRIAKLGRLSYGDWAPRYNIAPTRNPVPLLDRIQPSSVDRHLMYQPCRLAPGDCFGPVIYFSTDRSKSAVRLTLRGEALRTNRTRPLNCERITIRRQLKMLVTKSEQIISTVESAFLALRLARRAHHPLHRKAFSPHSSSH
jgi:hypothetical protein